jgi:hypothetical protein
LHDPAIAALAGIIGNTMLLLATSVTAATCLQIKHSLPSIVDLACRSSTTHYCRNGAVCWFFGGAPGQTVCCILLFKWVSDNSNTTPTLLQLIMTYCI